MKKLQQGILLLLCLSMLLVFAGCDSKGDESMTVNGVDFSKFDGEYPTATIEMENGGVMKLELYPDVAPNTVCNFISLAKKGFYDGLTFHRVIPGFMIQGGDPDGIGSGGPGYQIRGEFTANGFNNDLLHVRGVISMARAQQMDSAGSQFFIMVETAPHLDGQYASFGKVTEGMEVADGIVSVETNMNDMPLEPQVIKSITIDEKGFDYPEPETM